MPGEDSAEGVRRILAAQERLNKIPYAAALGMTIDAASPSIVVVKVPWREDLVGYPETGMIAGGGVTGLLDNACGFAIKGWVGGQIRGTDRYFRPPHRLPSPGETPLSPEM